MEQEMVSNNNNAEFSRSEMYELFAVVDHHGTMDSGHYTCFVKHDGLWFRCDDSWIMKSNLQNVVNTKG
jgi:ubiquitin carboxyl-terminal hydrolase 22/27/51